MAKSDTVTALLLAWGRGQESALERLVPMVEADLRRLARRQMAKERAGHTLQTTALVNEAYLRLVERPRKRLRNRPHFFALAARLMRHVLVDHARAKTNLKRGAGFRRVSLSDASIGSPLQHRDVLTLDDALRALAAIDPRRGKVVELRFFGGLTVEETAHALGISVQTVMRDWKLARVWLRRELQRAGGRATESLG